MSEKPITVKHLLQRQTRAQWAQSVAGAVLLLVTLVHMALVWWLVLREPVMVVVPGVTAVEDADLDARPGRAWVNGRRVW